MPMSKEEFLESVQDMARDAKDPHGELASLRKEFQSIYQDVAPHDAEMATKLHEVMSSVDRLAEYAASRLES